MTKSLREKIFEWLVPVLLAAAVKVLADIHTEMRDVSRTLAVAVSRVDAHETRLANLERFFFPGPPYPP